MPIVLDTNVLVSGALFTDSIPGQVFSQAQLFRGLAFSQATFSELRDVLSRPKFERYINTDVRERFLRRCLDAATLVEIAREIRACRDPKDDKFLEVAVNVSAEYIVTGDQDLLSLHPFEAIPIITPADFLARTVSA